jgi:prepilin-type N-terminal cleavage/methylation domain-containing protein
MLGTAPADIGRHVKSWATSWGGGVRRTTLRPANQKIADGWTLAGPLSTIAPAAADRTVRDAGDASLSRRPRRGFSLVELLIVLIIVVILTSLLMPGLRAVRETANRLRCGVHLRQIGYAVTAYATDHNDVLPYSLFGSGPVKQPQEMMALTTGGPDGVFEGLGRLLPRCSGYLDSATCLYCPSHRGEHTEDRYDSALRNPKGAERAFSNYHYRGDSDFETGKRYRMTNGHDFLIASDGLRTKSDFNHRIGLNLLHGDLAITWVADNDETLIGQLPDAPVQGSQLLLLFDGLWDSLGKRAQQLQ